MVLLVVLVGTGGGWLLVVVVVAVDGATTAYPILKSKILRLMDNISRQY